MPVTPSLIFFQISDSMDIVKLFMLCFPYYFLVDNIILFFLFLLRIYFILRVTNKLTYLLKD